MLKIKQHLPFESKFHPYILASSKSCPEENWQFFLNKCFVTIIKFSCSVTWVAKLLGTSSQVIPGPSALITHSSLAAFPLKHRVWEHAYKLQQWGCFWYSVGLFQISLLGITPSSLATNSCMPAYVILAVSLTYSEWVLTI